MGNDCCQRQITLTEKGEKYYKILIGCFFIDLIFLFIRIFCGRNDGIFSTIIELVIFIMTFITCNYIITGFLIFFTLFDIFFILLFLGQRLQNKIQKTEDLFLQKGINKIGLYIEMCFLIFLIILVYLAFQAYKEFKAISYGQNYEGYEPLSNNDNIIEQGNNSSNTSTSSNNNNKSFVPFSGKGYVVGGK